MNKTNFFKIAFLGIAIFTSFELFAKWPIVSRHTSKGGFFGYDEVDWHIVNVEGVNDGIYFKGAVVKCSNPGFHRCPKSTVGHIVGTDLDPIDEQKAEDLINYALQKIEDGVFTGSHSITVYNVNSNQTRIYYVDWSANDAQALNSTNLV
ncbi:MAG: hypothetical protein ACK566_10525 [Bacteroidota bacterium]